MKKRIKLKWVKNNESAHLLKVTNVGCRKLFNVVVQEVPPSGKLSNYDDSRYDKLHVMKSRSKMILKLWMRYSGNEFGHFKVSYELSNGNGFSYIQKVKF